MKFSVYLHPKAKESLDSLDAQDGVRVVACLRQLGDQPRKGRRLKPGSFRYVRAGDFRAINEVNVQSRRVIVLYVGHRRNVCEEFGRWM